MKTAAFLFALSGICVAFAATANPLPTKIGQCASTTIKDVGTRPAMTMWGAVLNLHGSG